VLGHEQLAPLRSPRLVEHLHHRRMRRKEPRGRLELSDADPKAIALVRRPILKASARAAKRYDAPLDAAEAAAEAEEDEGEDEEIDEVDAGDEADDDEDDDGEPNTRPAR